MESDKDLRDQIKAVTPADEQKYMACIVEIVLGKGYQFTAEEMKDVAGNMKNGELSQEVLNTIVGGIGFDINNNYINNNDKIKNI